MKHIAKFTAAGLLAAILPATAQASIVVNILETGGDIFASYNGSLDTSNGLIFVGGDNNLDVAKLSVTTFRLGTPFTNLGFSGFLGPANWGSSAFAALTISANGDFFVLDTDQNGGPRIYIPKNYIFGRTLSGDATFADVTFASLGLNEGQYVYTGPADQTITVNIGNVGEVPEPASWALMTLGFGVIGATLRRREKFAARFRFA